MKGFLHIMGLDGVARAVKAADIRMLQDEIVDRDGATVQSALVTLCDGAQFSAEKDVAGILGQIEAMEP